MPTGPGAGSSPLMTESSRSTATNSATDGTTSSASSCAVRVTSSVLPIRLPASFSRARRSWARRRSVTSTDM